jgi:serine/threonine protein kinase
MNPSREALRPIDHDRYTAYPDQTLGSGNWGSVVKGWDRSNKQCVAIKLYAPSEVLAHVPEVEKERQSTMLPEEGYLAPCGYLVPHRWLEDNNGQAFVVMPPYTDSLADLITKDDERLHFGNGISENVLFEYLTSIANSLDEMHNVTDDGSGFVHNDIKEANYMFDRITGRLLLNDFGTARRRKDLVKREYDYSHWECLDDEREYIEVATLADSEVIRKNIFWTYTRPPGYYVGQVDVNTSMDCHSAANLMYRLFTGKYVFEDEIDAVKDEGQDAVTDMMHNLAGYDLNKSGVRSNLQYSKTLDDKLDDPNVPSEFRFFLKKYLEHTGVESINCERSGRNLKEDLKGAIDSYKSNRIKRDAVKEYVASFRNIVLKSALSIVGIGIVVLGGAWIHALSPRPEDVTRTDVAARVALRDIPRSGMMFRSESYRLNSVEGNPQEYFDRYGAGTLSQKITALWKMTEDQMGYEPIERSTLRFRHFNMSPNQHHNMERPHECLNGIVGNALGFNLSRPREIDLEDAIADALVGATAVARAQRVSGSVDFDDYVYAEWEGEPIFSPRNRVFLQSLRSNVLKHFPEVIVKESDSSQSE